MECGKRHLRHGGTFQDRFLCKTWTRTSSSTFFQVVNDAYGNFKQRQQRQRQLVAELLKNESAMCSGGGAVTGAFHLLIGSPVSQYLVIMFMGMICLRVDANRVAGNRLQSQVARPFIEKCLHQPGTSLSKLATYLVPQEVSYIRRLVCTLLLLSSKKISPARTAILAAAIEQIAS